jgi:hypothetical protein
MSNSIWKTGSPKGIYEEDRLGDCYVAEFHREDGSSFYEAGGTCDICGIPNRWTFLTDLIAQADKAERLQKVVDLAVETLKFYADRRHYKDEELDLSVYEYSENEETGVLDLDDGGSIENGKKARDAIKQLIKGE